MIPHSVCSWSLLKQQTETLTLIEHFMVFMKAENNHDLNCRKCSFESEVAKVLSVETFHSKMEHLVKEDLLKAEVNLFWLLGNINSFVRINVSRHS